nr:uncharacterized mitochondrial protein AtMg00810-like [Tanacetum cinerariifolium]
METMNVSFDELLAMAFEQRSSKPGLQCMTSRQISLGLDLTYAPSTITKQQPTEGELDLLFEAMYDDYFGGQSSATDHPLEQVIGEPSRPVLTRNQLRPDGDMCMYALTTKDHPLEQVIGEPSRPVLTRNQLRSDGDMCMYALTVSTMKPKNVKEAMTDPAWIESMQEELRTIDSTLFIRRFVDDILVAKPTEKHLKEVKRIFCYLRGTVNTSLWYTKDSGFELTGFSDADYAGCKDTFKSTSGGAQFLGEKLVSWSSKKQ